MILEALLDLAAFAGWTLAFMTLLLIGLICDALGHTPYVFTGLFAPAPLFVFSMVAYGEYSILDELGLA